MNFDSYLGQAWSDHATQPQQVADGFSTGASKISTPEQISQLATLITHVMGEHLGQWTSGENMLNSLKANPQYAPGTEAEDAIRRSVAALKLAGGDSADLKSFSDSDQIRICAVAASALSDKNIHRASELFGRALALADKGLTKENPAIRALAVTGYNLACSLEERSNRTADETNLMINAALAQRKYWEIAGTWTQVNTAEYRLAMSYVAAGDGETAVQHANSGIEIAKKNSATAYELFYSYEALAVAERARGNKVGFKVATEKFKTYFAELSDDQKSQCEATFRKLA